MIFEDQEARFLVVCFYLCIAYANATIENQSSKQAKITWSNKMENSETFCDYPNKEFTVSYSLEDEMSKGYVLVSY